jgi:hypothetical protein
MASSPDSEMIQSVEVFPKSDSDFKSPEAGVTTVESTPETTAFASNFRKTLFGYVKTKQFWLVLVFGYVISSMALVLNRLCLTLRKAGPLSLHHWNKYNF